MEVKAPKREWNRLNSQMLRADDGDGIREGRLWSWRLLLCRFSFMPKGELQEVNIRPAFILYMTTSSATRIELCSRFANQNDVT